MSTHTGTADRHKAKKALHLSGNFGAAGWREAVEAWQALIEGGRCDNGAQETIWEEDSLADRAAQGQNVDQLCRA